MRKEEQININTVCETYWKDAMKEYENEYGHAGGWSECKRLLSCQAYVYETEHYYILRSYNTFVALIVKNTDICIDMLRQVYGYTATSAKHISKFRKATCYGGYGAGKWGCVATLTAR